MRQPWFDYSVDVSQLRSFLTLQAEGALDALHGPSRTVIGLVTGLHKSGKGLHLYLSPKESLSVPMRVIKGKSKPNPGDYLRVTVAGEGEELTPLAAEINHPTQLAGVEISQNELRVTDKGFGFAGDVFIPPDLINAEMSNRRVEVLSYQAFDKKKGRMGSRALKLVLCDG